LGDQRTSAISTLPAKGLSANPVRAALTKKAITNFGNAPSEYLSANASKKLSEFEVKPLNVDQKSTIADNQDNAQSLSYVIDAISQNPYGLLRPAQRALPAAVNKPLPEEPINDVDDNQDYFASFVRKPASKRTTTVFKEIPADVPSLTAAGLETALVACSAVEDNTAGAQSLFVHETHDESVKSEDIVANVIEETSLAHGSTIPVVENHAPTKPMTQLVQIIQQLNEGVVTEQPSEPGSPEVSNAICSVDSESAITKSVDLESDEVDSHPPALAILPVPAPADDPVDAAIDGPLAEHVSSELELYVPAVETQDSPATRPRRGSIDDLLEAWDEEEEYFDAENYSIARYDNTTGTSMIVPEPRFTARTAQELAHAKEWVEENTSDEEMEEEAWDMTLVTEYGEEIFSYLRKVEVSFKVHHRF
jgi:hypothetical protein